MLYDGMKERRWRIEQGDAPRLEASWAGERFHGFAFDPPFGQGARIGAKKDKPKSKEAKRPRVHLPGEEAGGSSGSHTAHELLGHDSHQEEGIRTLLGAMASCAASAVAGARLVMLLPWPAEQLAAGGGPTPPPRPWARPVAGEALVLGGHHARLDGVGGGRCGWRRR